VDAFSVVTEDPQWIHQSGAKERGSPFGGAISHGYLTLSLTSRLCEEAIPQLEGVKAGVNYGLDKVRFVSPVHVGKRIRSKVKLVKIEEIKGGIQNELEVTVEVEGGKKPALVFIWLTRIYF